MCKAGQQTSAQAWTHPRDRISFSYHPITSSFDAEVAAVVATIAGPSAEKNDPLISELET
jgi:hypothetical protein